MQNKCTAESGAIDGCVNLVVTLCSETQQVAILLYVSLQRQVLPSMADRLLLTLDNGRKQGNNSCMATYNRAPRPAPSCPLGQTHKCINLSMKSPYFNANTNTLIQTISVFLFVRETEDNDPVTRIRAWHRQTGRDPLCIEGYSC